MPDSQMLADQAMEQKPITTSIDTYSLYPDCTANDCAAGRSNQTNATFVGADTSTHIGRFGVRSGGAFLMQFVIGGAQGELGITTPLNPNQETSFINATNPDCQPSSATSPQSNEFPVSTPVSLRALMRLTAPPEYGAPLLALLNSADPKAPGRLRTEEEKVRHGAELFGVDLKAFADRVIAGRMPAGGDGLDDHAINQSDRKLNCVGCHFPVTITGQLPADIASTHVNNKWAPLFSDLLLHQGPSINAERDAPTVRQPLLVWRHHGDDLMPTLDLPRSFADDALPKAQNGNANGREFRTAPLMGIGRIGPPFMHDGRVYLSSLSVKTMPASTVYSDADTTNAPLVVQTVEEALLAAIELHDLPQPDTSGRCPGACGQCDW